MVDIFIVVTYLKNKQFLTETRRKLRNNATAAEQVLWEEIRRKKLGVKFRRQYSFGTYIMDFYCPEIKLGLEVDGDIHLSQKDFDVYRTRTLNEYGITILRFANSQIFIHLQNCVQEIKLQIIAFSPSLQRRDVQGGNNGYN